MHHCFVRLTWQAIPMYSSVLLLLSTSCTMCCISCADRLSVPQGNQVLTFTSSNYATAQPVMLTVVRNRAAGMGCQLHHGCQSDLCICACDTDYAKVPDACTVLCIVNVLVGNYKTSAIVTLEALWTSLTCHCFLPLSASRTASSAVELHHVSCAKAFDDRY